MASYRLHSRHGKREPRASRACGRPGRVRMGFRVESNAWHPPARIRKTGAASEVSGRTLGLRSLARHRRAHGDRSDRAVAESDRRGQLHAEPRPPPRPARPRQPLYIFVNRADRDRFAGVLPRTFALAPICFRPRPARLTFQQVILPAAATALGLDVVHSPSFIMPLYRGRQRHLLTVHDMTIFSLPHYHIPLRRSALFRRVVAWSIRHADLVSVPSRSGQQAISRLLYSVQPERIRVIPQGIRDVFRPRPAEQAHARARRLGISAPYILYVGTIEPRKNLLR